MCEGIEKLNKKAVVEGLKKQPITFLRRVFDDAGDLY